MTLSQDQFKALAEARGDALISIYLPTHEAGPEIRQDHIRFKNLLTNIENKADGLSHDQKTAVRKRVDQLRPLIDDAGFWRRQGKGLAIFASDHIVMHRLATPVSELFFISDRFAVRPLLPAISTGERFYILDLNEQAVRLIACTRDGARELDADDIPRSLSEALGYDYEQKSLQFHTEAQPVATPTDRAAMFHGHGSGGEEDDNKELRRFLEIIDNGVRGILEGKQAPLILAGAERVCSMYQHASHYDQTLETPIKGNHEHQSIDELHQMALPIAEPVLDRANERERERFEQVAHTDQAVAGLDHCLMKAQNAQIDTLFVDAHNPVWGRFEDGESGLVNTHNARRDGDDDLLDRLVHRAYSTGAKIIPTDRDRLPGRAPVAAILRF